MMTITLSLTHEGQRLDWLWHLLSRQGLRSVVGAIPLVGNDVGPKALTVI